MLRPLYRCLLYLHPPGFRKRFGVEILSIFDDVSRAARLKLVFDALLSLARQWTLRPEFWQGVPAEDPQFAADGVPSFHTLDPFRPRAAAMVHALILTAGVFCLTCFAIRYSWIRVLHVQIPEVQFERPQWIPPSSSPGDFRGKPSETFSQTKASIAPPSAPQTDLTSTAPEHASSAPIETQRPEPAAPESKLQGIVRASAASKPRDATNSSLAGVPSVIAEDSKLDAVARRRVIDGAVTNLEKYYVYPEVAQKMATDLQRHESMGDDDDASDGEAFAALLTTQLRAVSHDRHLMVVYSAVGSSRHALGSTPEELARYRADMARTNCTFETVAVLPDNIGYLKFNSFPEPSLCQSTAAAAMARLNHADAIIFDLRDNRGGSPSMVALMASYLFEHPTHLDDLYNRSEDSTLQSWTLSPVPGNTLANKPAFVLTSASTFSGAEEFAYDLKLLKRATLVGETTAGGAHMVRRRRIDDHFTIGVPDTRPINPISHADWEGTGVTPDVSVKSEDALKAAESLAQTALQKK